MRMVVAKATLAKARRDATFQVVPGALCKAMEEAARTTAIGTTATIGKRFDSVGIANTEENRRAYREMLLTTPNLSDYISGAILFDETLRQSTKDGVPFAKVMMDAGILPGIKVDTGAKALAGCPGETVTEGLDGLRERLQEYAKLGAKFAKWRAVISIGEDIPTGTCIESNAHALARYAALCQEAGIVPMVEPEVLMDGAHTIDRCAEATEWALKETFQELYYAGVQLEGIILKPNLTGGVVCLRLHRRVLRQRNIGRRD
jgi:fructose-bisphosphate aldolase class I